MQQDNDQLIELKKQKKVLKAKFTRNINTFESCIQYSHDMEAASLTYSEIKKIYKELSTLFQHLQLLVADNEDQLNKLIEEECDLTYKYRIIRKAAGEINDTHSTRSKHDSDSDKDSNKSHEGSPSSSYNLTLNPKLSSSKQQLSQRDFDGEIFKISNMILNKCNESVPGTSTQQMHVPNYARPFIQGHSSHDKTGHLNSTNPFLNNLHQGYGYKNPPEPSAPIWTDYTAPPAYNSNIQPAFMTSKNDNRRYEEDKYNTQWFQQPVIHPSYPSTHPFVVSGTQYPIPIMPLRLKPIELIPFTGNPQDWEQFRDTYTALIHETQMHEIEKFQRLQSLLVNGKAESFVKNMQITAQNYYNVWKDLNEYYENPRRIAMAHVTEMFSLKSMKDENADELRSVVDTFKTHLRGLQSAKQAENVEIFQIQLLLSKLDETTRAKWQSKLANTKEVPRLQDLYKLIEKRISSLEAIQPSTFTKKTTLNSRPSDLKRSHSFSNTKQNVYFTSRMSKNGCTICNDKNYHSTQQCPIYIDADDKNKLDIVKQHQLCHNCLRTGHGFRNCLSGECRETNCKLKHHTTLHHALVKKPESICLKTVSNSNVRKKAMIGTAVLILYDDCGRTTLARALIDGGSEDNCMTVACMKKLNLKPTHESVEISGINKQSNLCNATVNVNLKSRISNFGMTINCIVVENITENLPSHYVNTTDWNIPDSCKLADPTFNEPGKIDILLSADLFYGILLNGNFKLADDKPYMVNTKFGWLVAGGSYSSASMNMTITPTPAKCFLVNQHTISKQIEQFWELEAYPDTKIRSQEDELCELTFQQTHVRKDGRFTVKLPFKCDPPQLDDNLRLRAERLWIMTERRFDKDKEIQPLYTEFMQTYLKMGHMVKANPSEIKYFIPHHYVWKPGVNQSKFRVVFNASAKTSGGTSLNDMLMIGPNVQDELTNILLRFRKHEVAVAGDLEKMYRMVEICESDQAFQGIVWRENPQQPLQHFKLCTVTYGTACGAFLATRCLQEAINKDGHKFPIAKTAAETDFYVDDFLSGAASETEAIKLRKEIQTLCEQNGFIMKKWISNSPEVLATIPKEFQANNVDLNFDKNETVKTLGIQWSPTTDTFKFTITNFSTANNKRSVLSDIARIFDPLGLLGPVILSAKVFMQSLWKERIDWNDELPQHLLQIWNEYKKNVQAVPEIEVKRKIIPHKDPISLHLFGFSDACEYGYGAAVYLVSVYSDEVVGSLVCSKSNVAPLKTQSIPRLELCGALKLAELLTTVSKALKIDLENILAFTDSTIVLSWLSKDPSTWKTFIANRVSRIVNLVPRENWYHVSSSLNPADILSRGCTPLELKESNLWWFGPTELFVQYTVNQLVPQQIEVFEADNLLLEAKLRICKVTVSDLSDDVIDCLLNSHSKLSLIVRVIAYCRRFINNCKMKVRDKDPLSYNELLEAQLILARKSQDLYLKPDIEAVRNNKPLPKNSKLHPLRPKWDEERNCLTVGGRLSQAKLPKHIKHPVILPQQARFTRMLFEYEHEKLLHAGPQLLLSSIRRYWWPINGKRTATTTVHKCVRCFKVKPRLQSQIMADLPNIRLNPTKPFYNCGVDFAGPIETLQHEGGRCKVFRKSYFAIFVCFSTRAIHIETVSELTTEAFMAALRRFISRRGKVANIYSDHGSNFIGANNQLKSLYEMLKGDMVEAMKNEFDYIKWHFICTASPHTGALWEANIKSVKHHLRRVMGLSRLNFESFTTLLTQIEACVNSRPICLLSETPEEILPLTPAHFLTGDSLIAIPDHDYVEKDMNRLNRWCRIQKMVQDFWKTWNKEYIHTLQNRYRWQEQSKNLNIGDIVIVKEDNLRPLQWRLGRITKTFEDIEGDVRSVELMINKHVTTRTVHKLCKLPLEDDLKLDS